MPFECNTLRVSGKKSLIHKFLCRYFKGDLNHHPLVPSYWLSRDSWHHLSGSKSPSWEQMVETAEDRHNAQSEFRRNVFNSALSEMFLMHQLGFITAQLWKLDFSKKYSKTKLVQYLPSITCRFSPCHSAQFLVFQFRSDFLSSCSWEGFPTCWPSQQSGTTCRYW